MGAAINNWKGKNKGSSWIGKIVIVVFLLGVTVLFIGLSLDKAGGTGNVDVVLEARGDQWICRFTFINEHPSRYFSGGLGTVTLNGLPSEGVAGDFRVEAGEKRTFEVAYPSSAAEPGKVAQLTYWVKESRFGHWSNSLNGCSVYPLSDEELADLKTRPAPHVSDPFLQIFPSWRGWVCRYTYKNNSPNTVEFSVQRSFLNGHEAVQYPGRWTLLPGSWIAREVVFPLDAAHMGRPASFKGWYQVEPLKSGRHTSSLRSIEATLRPSEL